MTILRLEIDIMSNHFPEKSCLFTISLAVYVHLPVDRHKQ